MLADSCCDGTGGGQQETMDPVEEEGEHVRVLRGAMRTQTQVTYLYHDQWCAKIFVRFGWLVR